MVDEIRTGWDNYLRFARRCIESPGFQRKEIDYKLDAVKSFEDAMNLPPGDEWRTAVRRGFTNRDANIVSHWSFNPFLGWVESEVEVAHRALSALWNDTADDAASRIEALDENFPREELPGDGVRCNVFAYLLSAKRPYVWPNYRAQALRQSFELAHFSLLPDGASLGERYDHALSFFDETIVQADSRDLHLRHRLDAQGVMWAVVHWQKKPADFTAEEWNELLAFRAVPSQLRRHRGAGSARPKVIRRPSRPVCPTCGHDDDVILVGRSGDRWIWTCENPKHEEDFDFESS